MKKKTKKNLREWGRKGGKTLLKNKGREYFSSLAKLKAKKYAERNTAG